LEIGHLVVTDHLLAIGHLAEIVRPAHSVIGHLAHSVIVHPERKGRILAIVVHLAVIVRLAHSVIVHPEATGRLSVIVRSVRKAEAFLIALHAAIVRHAVNARHLVIGHLDRKDRLMEIGRRANSVTVRPEHLAIVHHEARDQPSATVRQGRKAAAFLIVLHEAIVRHVHSVIVHHAQKAIVHLDVNGLHLVIVHLDVKDLHSVIVQQEVTVRHEAQAQEAFQIGRRVVIVHRGRKDEALLIARQEVIGVLGQVSATGNHEVTVQNVARRVPAAVAATREARDVLPELNDA
jgi:hypothetical protein